MKSLLLTVILFSTLKVFAAPMAAYYEVPTSQADLKSASQFEIKKLSVTNGLNNVTTLNYTVPEELTGLLNEMEFSGALNQNGGKLVSENGEMECLANNARMMCTVSYQKIDFDSDLAKNILRSKFKDQELEKRFLVQEKFSTDPIGIIHIILQSY